MHNNIYWDLSLFFHNQLEDLIAHDMFALLVIPMCRAEVKNRGLWNQTLVLKWGHWNGLKQEIVNLSAMLWN